MTTSNRFVAVFMGVLVTILIQRSAATDMMVIGFVNSGLMTLMQAIGVIMGANIGTTVTAWILSLGGIDSGNLFVQLLKPSDKHSSKSREWDASPAKTSIHPSNASSIQPTINIDKSKIPKIPSIISPTPLHKNSSKSELSI